MKLNDPTTGKVTSDEYQYNNKKEWQAAIDAFKEQQPEAKRYSIKNGYSFFGDIEHRFVRVKDAITSLVNYYTSDEHNSDALNRLIELYKNYTSPAGGYLVVKYPYEEGKDEDGRPSARCIMANAKTGAPVGLLINPTFPKGHPIKHRHGLRRETNKYLPLLAGLAIGIALGPALQGLSKLLSKRR